MSENQIEKLMDTVMGNIKSMVDVNTIVGDAVETPAGDIIIPVSRVSFGFAAGGGEIREKQDKKNTNKSRPFAGGSGAGITLNPIAFLVVKEDKIRLLPVGSNAVAERLLNLAPEVINQIQNMLDEKSKQGELNRNEL
ncbi:MAG: GerW family sporulation protein [Halanaerobiales bacterium]